MNTTKSNVESQIDIVDFKTREQFPAFRDQGAMADVDQSWDRRTNLVISVHPGTVAEWRDGGPGDEATAISVWSSRHSGQSLGQEMANLPSIPWWGSHKRRSKTGTGYCLAGGTDGTVGVSRVEQVKEESWECTLLNTCV